MFQGLNRLFFRLVNRPSLPNIKVPHSHRSRLLFLAMKFRRIFPDVKYDGLNNADWPEARRRSEEHTSELQSHVNLVCRLLLDPATTDSYTLSLHDALPILFLAMKFRRIFPDVKYDGLNNADWPEARRWVPDAMRTTPCPLDSCRTPRRQLNLPV